MQAVRDLGPLGDKPLDNVTLTSIFEYENIVLYEFRKDEGWVDKGRGILKGWRRVTESYTVETTWIEHVDGEGGAHVPTWAKYIVEDIMWCELSQSKGSAPVWSHRITADTTRYVSYPVQGAALLSVIGTDGRKVFAFRELIKRVVNNMEMYVEEEEEEEEVEEGEEGKKEEDVSSEEDAQSEEETLGEEEVQKDNLILGKRKKDNEHDKKEDKEVEEIQEREGKDLAVTTDKEIQNMNKTTEENGSVDIQNEKKESFAWFFIDFLREKTQALGQINKTQLPKYLSLSGLKMYMREDNDWKDYGYGTVEIYKVAGKKCLRFLQKGTGKTLLVSNLATCIYQPKPTKQNAVLLSCDSRVGKGISERVTVAFRHVPEPTVSEMDRLERESGILDVEALAVMLKGRLKVSDQRVGYHAAQTFVGALHRTPARWVDDR